MPNGTADMMVPVAAWVLGVTLAIVGLIDIWLAGRGEAATISAWIGQNAARYPIIPFLAGMLAGHLFWQRA